MCVAVYTGLFAFRQSAGGDYEGWCSRLLTRGFSPIEHSHYTDLYTGWEFISLAAVDQKAIDFAADRDSSRPFFSGLGIYDLQPEKNIIFAYGSLKRGGHNHREYMQNTCVYEDALFIGPVRIPRFRLYRLCDSYPVAVQSDNAEDVIQAEAFAVKPELLKRLDALEGHPNSECFIRTRVSDANGLEGWIYCRTQPPLSGWENKLIADGVW